MTGFDYPTTDEILAIHAAIVDEDDATESGVRNRAAVESALTYVRDGYFGRKPETLPEKAGHLMRLLASEHPFVDGNKRTALNAAETLLALNGVVFDYDDATIRKVLRQFATDADSVEMSTVIRYIRKNTYTTEA